jgi:hypothetical protein
MKRMRWKKEGFSLKFLFWICAVWYFVQMVIVGTKYLDLKIEIPIVMRITVFIIFLSIYVATHEHGRWMKKLGQERRGECFVWGWCVFVTILLIGQFLSHGRLRVPMSAWENLIFIVSVFFGTRISKILYRLRTHGRRLIRYYAIRVILGFRGTKFVCWLTKWARRRKVVLKRLKKLPGKREDNSNANHFSRAA